MILRPEIFTDDHLPRQLLHREPETKQLLRALDPGPGGDDRGHALVSGSSGVGKTVLTRYCCRELERERSIDHAVVHCLGSGPGTILRDVVGELRYGPDELAHNTPVDEVIDELHGAVRGTAVVVLDEADHVDDRAVEILSDIPGVSIAMICHEPERWYSNADHEVRERLKAGTELSLERYGVSELADILERRADVGLDRGVIGRDQLEAIADETAGVARKGIFSLRAAAELATDRGHDRIEAADVDDAYGRARAALLASNLASLPFEHQFLYEIIRQAGEITSGELYDHYHTLAERAWSTRWDTPPSTNRAVRNHLAKLREYELISSEDDIHKPTDPTLAAPADPLGDIELPGKPL